jgi:hypothetical protein
MDEMVKGGSIDPQLSICVSRPQKTLNIIPDCYSQVRPVKEITEITHLVPITSV